jgi:hypothetical protein
MLVVSSSALSCHNFNSVVVDTKHLIITLAILYMCITTSYIEAYIESYLARTRSPSRYRTSELSVSMADSWWNDFSNNLATDLAPLIALLGESPTKQFLSECIDLNDIVIFAVAPLGIITAVVSAIRVCGTPSLRAFIGRAKEGSGVVEVELCSSTSQDVCELYTNGGISRVFGRPKLLEIVHDPHASLAAFYPPRGGKSTAGIQLFQDYINTAEGSAEWVPQPKFLERQKSSLAKTESNTPSPNTIRFAPNPNLSLNIGIKPLGRAWFIIAAVFGTALQLSVLIWATLTRYYYQWTKGGREGMGIPVLKIIMIPRG